MAALARIDPEHANLTAAAERMLAAGDVEGAARMAWALWLYWWLRGHHGHGRRLAEAVLARGGMADDVHARAALAAATMAFAMDDVDAALHWWQDAHRHSVGDPVIDSNSVAGIGLVALARGDLVTAREQFDAALVLAAEGGEESEWTWALAHIWLGTVALLLGDPDEAVRRVEDGLASARRRGDRLASYIALYNLFQVELTRGEHARARAHLEEGLRLSAGDRRPGQPGLPARRAGRHRGRRGHRVAGAAAARRRPGDPRDDRLPRLRLLPTRPGRRSPPPRPRRGSASAPTGTTTPWTPAGRSRRTRPPTWRSGSHHPA